MTERKFLPFPTIPKFPEESPLQGPPAGILDTLLYDKQLPYFSFAADSLNKFMTAQKAAERQSLTANLANQLVASSDKFAGFYESLSLLEAASPQQYQTPAGELRFEIAKRLKHAAKNISTSPKSQKEISVPTLPNPKQLEGFLKIVTGENPWAQEARYILRGFIEGKESQEAVVDFWYNACLAALNSQNEAVEKFLALLSAFKLPEILSPSDRQAALFVTASLAESNEVLASFFEVDHTLYLLRQIYCPENEKDFVNGTLAAAENPICQSYQAKQNAKNPERVEKILNHYQQEEAMKKSPDHLQAESRGTAFDFNAFPASLLLRRRPLRVAYIERRARYLEATTGGARKLISLPAPPERIYAFLINSPEPDTPVPPAAIKAARFQLTTDIYSQGEGKVEAPEEITALLENLAPPDLTKEQCQKLDSLRQELKKALWSEVTCSVSPRGERVIVDDERLKNAGLTDLLFELGRNKDGRKTLLTTQVTLTFGRWQVPLLIEKNYILIQPNGRPLPLEEEARIWWETVLFSYLHKITCREEEVKVEEKGPKKKEEDQEQSSRKYISRKAHRRRLPPGQSYTETQAQAVKDIVDLAEYNAWHGRTREMGMYTWVKPVDYVDYEVQTRTDQPPLRVRIPNATAKIIEILQEK